MSHFTVLVVGPKDDAELEAALAPFDENIELEPYLDEDYDVEAEYQSAREYLLKDGTPEEELVDKAQVLRDWDGGDFREEDGVLRRYSTWNKGSKWDWWSVGGRWQGFFALKDGATGELGEASWASPDLEPGARVADRVRKGDVDFEGMRREAREAAQERFDKFEEVFERHGGNWGDMTWRDHQEDPSMATKVRAAAQTWHASDLVSDLRENGLAGPMSDPYQEFSVGREAYVRDAELSSSSTYAVLLDGEWLEAGKMGWFGIGAEEEAQRAFRTKVGEVLDALDDDVVLTVVDCHV
jgi:hypothetical protein